MGIFLRRGVWSVLSLVLMAVLILGVGFLYLESQLPDASTLEQVQLQQPMRIYSADGKLMAQFGAERRTPISYAKIPKQLINAVLATEDARFFEHSGIDIMGLGRATLQLIMTGSKQQGGSTITMQVARNFFLSPEKTYVRKLKEILLAINIDQHFSKKQILELYLNKIYFGNRAYGIAAAAWVYYGTTLDKLCLGQMAMLAGLPKAPSTINPLVNKKAAMQRRNHVLQRMYELGYISEADYHEAQVIDDDASYHGLALELYAPYGAEMVRNTLLAQYGDAAYTEGYKVFTTLDSRLQTAANQALASALLAYDQRHGYRGPEDQWGALRPELQTVWQTNLQALSVVHELLPAAVIEVGYRSVQALLADGQVITIPWQGLEWARPYRNAKYPGAKPNSVADILQVGDVIRVQARLDKNQTQWRLAQVPAIEGALVSLNPQNGAIEALVGGFSYNASNFNRALQAERQPGSSFKPFIYSAALANGFTLASIVNDAPIVIDDHSQQGLWRPQNDKHQFNGPTRLKEGLIHSLNLVSIRLLNALGLPKAIEYLQNFGFDPHKLPQGLSLALGTASVTPLQQATAYAVLANGGFKVTPYLINQVIDGKGQLIFKAEPQVACYQCENTQDLHLAPQVMSPQIAYLMNTALQEVIKRGTGGKAIVLHRPDLAGKTGTTNDKMDAWFAGFTPNIVTITWMGFDTPHSIYEYGGEAALPMWIDYMQTALQYKPVVILPPPSDIVTVRIDPYTGLLAAPEQDQAIFESFIAGTEPKEQASEQQALTSSAEPGSDYEQIF